MNILMAASECAPLIKVGGLADVLGCLPRHLAADTNVDIRVVIPRYLSVNVREHGLSMLPHRLVIPVGDGYEEARIWEGKIAGGVTVYCIENSTFFERSSVYGNTHGDYPDNNRRFAFFCRAVLEAAKAVGFQPDVIHCHDWQTGMLPAYLKTIYRIDAFFARTASVYTVHNIGYQGVFGPQTVGIAGFSAGDFTWDRLEWHGLFNCMKAGLVYADKITTVSPTYAREVQTPEGGKGMDGLLRARAADFSGILNGLDYDVWNPATDPHIAQRYSAADSSGKAACKQDLQRVCGLSADPGALLVGMVARLVSQKGFNLLADLVPLFMKHHVQMVFLGVGDPGIEKMLDYFSRAYPDRFCAQFEFSEPLAHRIYAGADAFLMPSLREACGLTQMIALAYGTVPVVHRTGGLADTVTDFDEQQGTGTGIVFQPADVTALSDVLERLRRLWERPEPWKKLKANAFNARFGWDGPARLFRKLYEDAVTKRRVE